MRKEIRLALLEKMLEIRLFEEKIISAYPRQDMKTPVHLYVGQEAIAAGVCANLAAEDYVFTTHRNHGHLLAKGADMKAIVAELYGKASGCCGGKGGSMHLADFAANCPGASAIVGGAIALAAGAALAAKMRGEKRLAVAFFGDGAADEGIFQESLNFAALKKLPVLCVCENNFYATNSHQKARQPGADICPRARALGIPAEKPDGNAVEAVHMAAKRAVKHIRAGKGPYFLQCDTYRWKGHVGPDCDYQKGCRPKAELDKWLKRCPVAAYRRNFSRDEIGRLEARINEKISAAWEFAESAPYPAPETLLKDVYALDKSPS
ncbi:MAG: thiamine pyrophosphate-dependent dehydrogenase E1 component subunit alpha [Elusimicrobiales bacterium]